MGGSHWLSLFLATVMVVVGGFGLTKWASGVGGDDLNQQQIQARQTAFEQMVQHGGFDVHIYDANESLALIPSIENVDRAVIVNIMEQASDYNNVRVAEITLWDDVEQDGDIVEFSALGLSQRVNLTHSPQTIHLPIQVGQPAQMTGIHDGGGGITLGFMVAGQPAQAPVLAPNQTIDVQFF